MRSSRFTSIAPERDKLSQDVAAGVTGGVSSVPDGMAAATLVGVNPVLGLYASIVGPVIGGLLTSTVLMRVTTTGAAALAAGSVLYDTPASEKAAALGLLVLIAGAFALLLGVLRLSFLMRFVSRSVMTGFLSGVAVLIVVSQIPKVTGTTPDADSALRESITTLLRVGDWDLATLLVAILTIGTVVLVRLTPLRTWSALIGLAVPTAVVAVLDPPSVAVVGSIPGGLPTPSLPSLGVLDLDIVTGGLAIAVIVVIQGAGVAAGSPNPDRSRTNLSRDFIAQGAANVGVGLVQGAPVGGSVGQTALNVQSGAQTRWGGIIAGLSLAVILLFFGPVVGLVPLASLGGLLILAGVAALDRPEVSITWSTSLAARIVFTATFIATLFLPIQLAIAIGAGLSALIFLLHASADAKLVELRESAQGIEEHEPPAVLPSNAVTVLDVKGSVFYAGAEAISNLLPRPEGSERPVVVLRMRSIERAGVTWAKVLHDYAQDIGLAGGKLWLAGVQPGVRTQLERSGRLVRVDEAIGNVLPATRLIGESTRRAVAEGEDWLLVSTRVDETG